MSIFRAYDIRGIVGETLTPDGETLTPDLVTQIGQAIGSEAEARGQLTIVIASDGRLSSPQFKEALHYGLFLSGREIVDIGMVPTPVLYFATYYFKICHGNGVMVTGSHNPPNYNGLKIMLGGETLFGEAIQALKTRVETAKFFRRNGMSNTANLHQAYIERITQDVKLARAFKVVVDCGNGVAGVIAPHLMRALGCEVVELYCDVDGHFPNHHPDPSQPENLEVLIRTVKEKDADLGLAFDGDGDRLGVVDVNGKIIWPDRQMMLYATDILTRNPGAKIIFDVKCSRHLSNVIKQQGGEPIMWKTGHSFIKSKIKETGALLGGEMSGHIFFKERWYGFDDALYSAARLLEILSHDSRSPTEVFASLPDSVNTPELKLELETFGDHYKLMDKIRQTIHFDNADICKIDGIRADFQEGWGLVRPSNTTPCLVIRFEADNQAALEQIQGQFRQQLLATDNTLQLPF